MTNKSSHSIVYPVNIGKSNWHALALGWFELYGIGCSLGAALMVLWYALCSMQGVRFQESVNGKTSAYMMSELPSSLVIFVPLQCSEVLTAVL